MKDLIIRNCNFGKNEKTNILIKNGIIEDINKNIPQIGYEELDRTTGKYSRLIIETTKAKVKEFNDNNSFKNIDELRLAMKEYIRRNAYGKYILTFYTAECEKTKKAF